MIRSFPPHPNPLPPGERVGHSSPQQSWGVFWHILIKTEKIAVIHNSIVKKKLGKLPDEILVEVKGKLRKALNI